MDLILKSCVISIVIILLIAALIYCLYSCTERDFLKKNWISLFAVCFSFIAILYCGPRTNLSFDYLGAIVAIISLAVAVFVATQIYQSFNLKKDIDVQNKELLSEVKSQFMEAVKSETKKLEDRYKDCESNINGINTTINSTINEMNENSRKMIEDEKSKISIYTDASAEYIQGLIVFQNMYTEQYGLSYSLFPKALLDYINAGIQVEKNVDNCIFNMEQFIKQKIENNLRKEEITYDYGKAVSYINQAIEIGSGLGAKRIKKLVDLENRRKNAIEKMQKILMDSNNKENKNG